MLAYIDPGMGALVWQIVVAAVVGAMFYLKRTRDFIFGLFRKRPRSTDQPDHDSQPSSAAETKAENGGQLR